MLLSPGVAAELETFGELASIHRFSASSHMAALAGDTPFSRHHLIIHAHFDSPLFAEPGDAANESPRFESVVFFIGLGAASRR